MKKFLLIALIVVGVVAMILLGFLNVTCNGESGFSCGG